MKIAIIAPSPVPFVIGGAEKLFLGIQEYINKNTTNQCELIKLPTKEHTFWDLIDSYYAFHTLDLSYFDLVISGKYPAWMTNHHNHHIYMLHTLRGLYDTYDYENFGTKIKEPKLNQLIELSAQKNISISKMFELLYALKEDKTLSSEAFAFPSAFAKAIINFFDKKAMQNIKSFSAISKTVALRKEYFPLDTSVKVIYPPSNLLEFKNNSYSYFFTASRLDTPKRVDMIVKAYLQADIDIPLKIAGSGAQYNYLKELSKQNPNIELLGFVSDIELEKLYSDAYATIFIPDQEDYGLITIESMMCEKPVITFDDAGGVLEFVKHKQTGLISEPSIQQLSKSIKKLASDKDLTISLGKNAYKQVENITFKNCINSLLNLPLNLTVVTTYPIYPPRGGGQNRVYYLYKELSKFFSITVVSLIHALGEVSKKQLAPNFYEIQVPKTLEHIQKEESIQKIAGIAITDIALIDIYELTPEYINQIKTSAKSADFIISTSPYTYPLLKKHTSKPIIYESQNVEYNLKKNMLEPTSYNQELLKKVYETEKECFKEAFLVTSCSKEDAKNFVKLYGEIKKDIPFVPNGVDLDSVEFYSKKRKLHHKKYHGYADKKVAIFMGSEHQPNIVATKEILKLALDTPDILYIIIGGLKAAFENKQTPKNVIFTGLVTNKEKDMYLSIADIALNPMLTGSGTNLKMLDYMASGIATISTKVGARGLDISSNIAVQTEIQNFKNYLENLSYYTDTKQAKRFVQSNYSWKVIAQNFKTQLLKQKF